MRDERRERNAEKAVLGVVGVDDEAAIKGVAASGDVAQDRGEKPSRAAFRGRDSEVRLADTLEQVSGQPVELFGHRIGERL